MNLFAPLRPLIFLVFLISSTWACGQTPDQLDREIGQMLLTGFRGLELADSMQVAEDLRAGRLGGVILFEYDVPSRSRPRNIESPQQVKSLVRQLQEAADTPLLIAIDQEGGLVSRLKTDYGFPPTVSAAYMGSFNSTDTTRFYAERTARTLLEAGINTNLGPVVDLNSNPDNPIIGGIDRAFSADPETVYRHARTWIAAAREEGIITAPKHFPGHGSSAADSHLGVVDVTDSWDRSELIPYRKLIGEGYADMVMTAHIYNAKWDSTWPATLSPSVVGGMLRDSLGYNGPVISDDMQMEAIRSEYGLETAIRQALHAGVDILVFGNNTVYEPEVVSRAHRIIRELVQSGEIPEDRIRRSHDRIMKLKREFGIVD